jgi:hypothetical protein
MIVRKANEHAESRSLRLRERQIPDWQKLFGMTDLHGNCRSLKLMSFAERSSSGAEDDCFKGALIQLKPRRRRKKAAHGASRG